MQGFGKKWDFEALEPILVNRIGRFGELNGGNLQKVAAVSDAGRAGENRVWKNFQKLLKKSWTIKKI